MTEPPKNPLSTSMPWDLVASGYEHDIDLIMRPISLEALHRAEAKMAGGLDSSSRVVDVACGPGTLTFELARRFAKVEALDFSAEMLSGVERGLAEQGLTNVTTTSGDGMALPYEDSAFDAAFSLFGLMFFPDRPKGFRELHRVLRPGGIATVSSWAPLDLSPAMDMMFGALRAASPEMPPPMRNLETLENPERFERELVDAGFVDVTIEPYEHHVAITGRGEDFFTVIARSAAPLVLMRKRVGEEEWSRRAEIAKNYLDEALAKWSGALSTTAYLGFGRKPT